MPPAADPAPSAAADGARSYALAAPLKARLMGVGLVLVGVVVFVATVAVSLLSLPLDLMSAVVVLALVGVGALGYLLNRRLAPLRIDAAGYQVTWVRGAGVAAARWADVEDMVTADVAGARCVVLRLRDGGTTTIPVDTLAGDPEELVRELRGRLQRRTPR